MMELVTQVDCNTFSFEKISTITPKGMCMGINLYANSFITHWNVCLAVYFSLEKKSCRAIYDQSVSLSTLTSTVVSTVTLDTSDWPLF